MGPLDLASAKALLLPVHGALGALAIAAGVVALFAVKRRGRHTTAGLAFVGLMVAAIAVATPVILLSGNLFLGGLGAVALYLTLSGLRIGQLRPPARMPTRLDRALVAASLAVFVLFLAFGLRVLVGGNSLGLAALGIGGLGARAAASHLRFFLNPAADSRPWTAHHGSALGGGCIASVTAFSAAVLTNAVPQVPEFLVWLTPVALGVPVLIHQLRRAHPAPPDQDRLPR